jgi:RimJ/RimL family protein N-acetyltransferase
VTVELDFSEMEGANIRLEPFVVQLKEEVRAAVDCDPEAWDIMPMSPTGAGFEDYWSVACGAPPKERMSYAIRRRADGRVVGMSTYYTSLADQGGIEIGTTFLHPDVRGSGINSESKLLMLKHAFDSGAIRVQFRVDTRNIRSQAAVAGLGAVREGVLRRDRLTWTGYVRDTVYFSILDDEWRAVQAHLTARLD